MRTVRRIGQGLGVMMMAFAIGVWWVYFDQVVNKPANHAAAASAEHQRSASA